jgi:hypothetical protein
MNIMSNTDPLRAGATLLIDGLERLTRNSDGRLIAASPAALKQFWSWFDGSYAVDGFGRPLVVYRAGSITQCRRGYHFTDKAWRAARYGMPVPYYLRIRRPFETDFCGNLWDAGNGAFNSIDDIAESFRNDPAFDGVIARNIRGAPADRETTTEFIVYSAAQIRPLSSTAYIDAAA